MGAVSAFWLTDARRLQLAICAAPGEVDPVTHPAHSIFFLCRTRDSCGTIDTWREGGSDEDGNLDRGVVVIVVSACGGSGVQLDTSEPWDLVWFSDSLGWDVAQAWADRIEDTEGVETRVHDHAIANLSAVQVRQWLSDHAGIREKVANAEVIVVYGNPEGSGATDDMKTCVSALTLRRDPPERYEPSDFAPCADVLREVYDLIFELRAGQPTVIRAFDPYSGPLAAWREVGIDAECAAAWGVCVETIRNTAEEYGVVATSMYDTFNGPNHDEDPREKGYIRSDGIHASPEGVAAQVEVLHALGYEPIVP